MALAAWQSTVVDESGDVQANAQIEVRAESSGGLAALYSDRDGLVSIGNPITAGDDGFVRFYTAGNALRIVATKGAFSRTWRHVSVGTLGERDTLPGSLLEIEITDAEIAVGVTPVNYAYAPDDSRRQGIIADNATNNDAAIARFCSVMAAQGGGNMYFRGEDAILINDDIELPSNVTVYCETWIKRSGTGGTYDAIFVGVPGATDITLFNPKLDCDSQAGMNCIIMRADNLRFKVIGGELKNCVHDKGGKLGGRAINIEAGVTDPDIPKSSVVTGVNIHDCYMAIALSGGDTQEDANCVLSAITVENCEVLIGLFGNAAGYPHDGDSMSYIVSGVIARNVGASTTYTRDHGIICADRGCNVLLSNIYVFNDSVYGTSATIAAVLYGDFANVHVSNFVYDGAAASIYTGYAWQEADSISDGGHVTQRNKWQITVNGTLPDTIVLGIDTANRFINSDLDFRITTLSNNRAITGSCDNKVSVFMRLYEATNNTLWEGFLNDFSASFQLDDTQNKRIQIGGVSTFDNNGVPFTLGFDTAGYQLVNGDEAIGLAIQDGISTPATVAGRATIYVDGSDGDLKCRFGDGTIKVIVADT
jgi:hypothetical protein